MGKSMKQMKFWIVVSVIAVLVIGAIFAIGAIPPKGGADAVKEANGFAYSGTYFSKKVVINKLINDGYSERAAKYAIKKADIDWEKQAENFVKQQIDRRSGEGYSYDELIKKMETFGFTNEEAVKAVESCEIDWNEQIVKAYEFYKKQENRNKDHPDGRKDSVEDRLKEKGFTDDALNYLEKYLNKQEDKNSSKDKDKDKEKDTNKENNR